jgi:hypothetical protein
MQVAFWLKPGFFKRSFSRIINSGHCMSRFLLLHPGALVTRSTLVQQQETLTLSIRVAQQQQHSPFRVTACYNWRNCSNLLIPLLTPGYDGILAYVLAKLRLQQQHQLNILNKQSWRRVPDCLR